MVTRVQNKFQTEINRVVEDNKKVSGKALLSFSDVLKARTTPTTTPIGDDSGRARMGQFSGRTYRSARAGNVGSGLSSRNLTMTHARRLAVYAPIIQQASRQFKVPVELICGVILQESGGNYRARSYCGAQGLMQLMPGTARRMGVANAYDPYQNIMGGTKYLRFLLDRFRGNVSLAVAGYNAGEGNVEKYGNRIPPFKETRAYVPNVLSYANAVWNVLRRPRMLAINETGAVSQRIVPSIIIPSHSKKV